MRTRGIESPCPCTPSHCGEAWFEVVCIRPFGLYNGFIESRRRRMGVVNKGGDAHDKFTSVSGRSREPDRLTTSGLRTSRVES